jgi:membrane protease YdiL (CAAX protease family)
MDPQKPEEGPEIPDDPDPEVKKAFANQLTTIIIVLEGLLGVGGILIGSWVGIEWSELIIPEPRAIAYGVLTGVGLVALHAILLFPGGDWNPLRRWIFDPFAETFLERMKLLSLEDILLISILSGTAEELLFRGWLQTEVNIVVASVVFGIIHIWGKDGIPYGLYAIGIGFVLGGAYWYTGNLWTPVIAHVLNNLFGLVANKYDWIPGLDRGD